MRGHVVVLGDGAGGTLVASQWREEMAPELVPKGPAKLAAKIAGIPEPRGCMSALMTRYLNRRMAALDIPPIPEFVEMIADTGAGLYACKASVDMFGLSEADFVDHIKGVTTVGEFYDLADGGPIVFT